MGRLAPRQRGRVRGLGDHHRALAAFRSQHVVDEFAGFPPPLADQADHDDVGVASARQHRHQHRLADTGAGKDAEALTAPHGDEGIENPDAQIHPAAKPGARVGAGRIALERVGNRALGKRRAVVEGAAETVEHPAEPAGGRPHPCRFGLKPHPRARANPFQRTERHHQGRFAAKADDLALGDALPRLDRRMGAQREPRLGALCFDKQAVERSNPPFQHALVETLDTIDQGLHHTGRPVRLLWRKCQYLATIDSPRLPRRKHPAFFARSCAADSRACTDSIPRPESRPPENCLWKTTASPASGPGTRISSHHAAIRRSIRLYFMHDIFDHFPKFRRQPRQRPALTLESLTGFSNQPGRPRHSRIDDSKTGSSGT